MLAEPAVHDVLFPEYTAPEEYWEELLSAGVSWTDGPMGKAWQPLFRMVELVDHGMMISNTDLASPGEDSRKHHWIRSGNTSDENWCPGAEPAPPCCTTDDAQHHACMNIADQATPFAPGIDVDPPLFGELCTAELHWEHLVENMAAAGTPPEQLNIGHGFHASNMLHGHDSSTLYFWARTPGSEGIDGISLAGMDNDHNLCFYISGRKASIMRYGSVSPEHVERPLLC